MRYGITKLKPDTMTTLKSKRLIAKFMGVYSYNSEWTDEANAEQYKYDTSWDWLMSVVKKIESIKIGGYGMVVVIQCESCLIRSANEIDYNNQVYDGSLSKKEATYKAVVEFIKWYNENK